MRELAAGDRDALFTNYADLEIAQYFLDRPLEEITQADRFIKAFQQEFEQGEAITWAITAKTNQRMLGTCSCLLKTSTCAELGYDLARDQWGKGIMTEALEAIIGFGFVDLGLEKIKADTLSNNTRSINLLYRLGFQLEGVREGSHFFTLGIQDYENRKI